jgi:hypothetical protein
MGTAAAMAQHQLRNPSLSNLSGGLQWRIHQLRITQTYEEDNKRLEVNHSYFSPIRHAPKTKHTLFPQSGMIDQILVDQTLSYVS